MRISTEINPSNLQVTRGEAMDFILELDAKFASTDFTLELLNRLVKSLAPDLTRQEIASELGFKP